MNTIIPFKNRSGVGAYELVGLKAAEEVIDRQQASRFASHELVNDLLEQIEAVYGTVSRQVLELRFGFGGSALSRREVAQELGLAPAQVAELESAALIGAREWFGVDSTQGCAADELFTAA